LPAQSDTFGALSGRRFFNHESQIANRKFEYP
jgi:hypothetical protein